MIDVMDKHFQEELSLTKSQSAWVQFAHYLGYFLMSIPAGWLASKLGYKGGIIAGLLMVAVGGFWFIPATHINALVHGGRVSPTMAFVAFWLGVCVIATGLTFLETIANPYTTVLGRPALCGHAHQPGPVLQRRRLDLRSDDRRRVLLLQGRRRAAAPAARRSTSPTWCRHRRHRAGGHLLLSPTFPTSRPRTTITWTIRRRGSRTPSGRIRILSMAVRGPVLYVAAQAGIFSFFINYMTSEVPAIPASWAAMTASAIRLPADWLRLVRNQQGRRARAQRQGRVQPGFAGIDLFSGRAVSRGAGLLRKFSAHKVLGLYGADECRGDCLLVF